jgi:hypothetical protein
LTGHPFRQSRKPCSQSAIDVHLTRCSCATGSSASALLGDSPVAFTLPISHDGDGVR